MAVPASSSDVLKTVKRHRLQQLARLNGVKFSKTTKSCTIKNALIAAVEPSVLETQLQELEQNAKRLKEQRQQSTAKLDSENAVTHAIASAGHLSQRVKQEKGTNLSAAQQHSKKGRRQANSDNQEVFSPCWYTTRSRAAKYPELLVAPSSTSRRGTRARQPVTSDSAPQVMANPAAHNEPDLVAPDEEDGDDICILASYTAEEALAKRAAEATVLSLLTPIAPSRSNIAVSSQTPASKSRAGETAARQSNRKSCRSKQKELRADIENREVTGETVRSLSEMSCKRLGFARA
eukprot:scaffold1938_cov399-Prasinococcus_capsulatus_cf.AAC.30